MFRPFRWVVAHNLKVVGSNPTPATKKPRLNSRLEAALTGGFLRSNISEALRKQEGARDCEFMRNDNRRTRTKTGVGRRAAASPTRQRLTLRQPFSDGRAVCNTYRTINTKGRILLKNSS
jgi:hypothetical protein